MKTLYIVSGTANGEPFSKATLNIDEALAFAQDQYEAGYLVFWTMQAI